MTPRELRKAAEYIVTMWDDHDSKRIVAGDELFFNSDGEPDSVTFARHILATVREDDDEPVTTEMIDQCNSKGNSVAVSHTTVTHFKALTTTMCVALLGQTGDWITIEKCKTRGQFRSLCKGLAIELKEKAC